MLVYIVVGRVTLTVHLRDLGAGMDCTRSAP